MTALLQTLGTLALYVGLKLCGRAVERDVMRFANETAGDDD